MSARRRAEYSAGPLAKSSRLATLALAVGIAVLPASIAHAQKQSRELQVSTVRGPASELYIRKRPPTPEAPVLSKQLKKLLRSTEKRRDNKRLEAIGLLRQFLASDPTGEARAEGTFKLAELLWEEARRLYLIKIEEFGREVERCSHKKAHCTPPTKEPRIDLKEAEKLYVELHDKFPDFRRIDLVTYLIGFSAKEDGREADAMAKFQEVIQKYPKSSLMPDAWMMVGEHHFANQAWVEAKAAYQHVPDNASTSDLATFKIAWCEWKLGNTIEAAKDFKRVLDKAIEAERSGTAAQRRRSVSLRDEALEYLVVVFTEDRSVSAKEVFDFLASIGGEQYSRDVLIRVAESYGAQTEWQRSNEAYRFLIKMDPKSIKAAEYQRDIVGNWNAALDGDKAQEEIKVLLDKYGPNSAWARAQKNRDALRRSLQITEDLTRTTATNIHGEAQRREKGLKIRKQFEGCADHEYLPASLQHLYTQAADAYESYLAAFGGPKQSTPKSIEVRYYYADILCFKLGKIEEAGDQYLAVGKSAPVGKLHKDALLNAMAAFEKARPKNTEGRTKLYPVDKKFGQAIDIYATLFKGDPTIVGVLFKNGQMFYDYGECDEAIKRFGLIVTQYAKDPNAGPAGDRILSCLGKAKDYENLEEWARKLKPAPSFQTKDKQELLSRLIVESIQKSGDKYAEAGKYERAAEFYLRVPKETSNGKVAGQAMMNAGVMYEKAKQPEKAADIYLGLAEKYGDSNRDLAERAAFSAGVVYERVIYYDRAAKAYELVWSKFRTGKKAPDALYNAGVLRQALGQNKEAISHYREYAKKFRDRKDAPDVAFNIGVVYENAGQDGPAYKAYVDYARSYRSSGKRVIEAWTRAGRMSFKLGQYRRAKKELVTAQKLWKSSSGAAKQTGTTWAAEARYYEGELVFRQYEKVSLDVKVRQLTKALAKKTKLLGEAEKVYISVADYKDLKWATAALYRYGQIYDLFAEALAAAAAKPPSNLPQDQVQAYQDKLNEIAVTIQDKAIEAYTAGYQKAIQMQVYDEFTAKIRTALGRVDAQRFPPERESRGKEKIGDRPPKTDFVTEIVR